MNQLSLFMFTCAAVIGSAQATPDMAQAWQTLSAQSSSLKSLQATLDAKSYDVQQAKARRLPSLNVSGRWNQLDDEIGLWIDPSIIMPTLKPIYYPIQDDHFFEAQLTAKLPLYTGGAIQAGINAANAHFNLASAQAEQEKNDLFTTFVERYLSVQLAEQKVAIRRQALDNLEQHLHRAERMYSEGTLALTEKLQTQVERDKALRNWRQATQDVQLASTAYKALFGGEADLPSGELVYQDIQLPSENEINQQVHSQSPVLEQLNANRHLLSAGKKLNNADYLPKVAAFAQVELYPEDLTALDPNWSVGIALEWKLLDPLWYTHKQALNSQQTALQWKQTQVESDLAVLIQQYLSAIDQAHSDYQALLSSIDLANENLRLQGKAFEQGLRTSLDKIDAQLLVTGLELESQKALFDYYLASARLYALMQEQSRFLQWVQSAQQP
jgi:outer membrane protein TolC